MATEKEIYNILLGSAEYRGYLDNHDYKRLYAEVLRDYDWITPEELTAFLNNANIKLIRDDGIIPPQIYKNSVINSFDFSKISVVGVGSFMKSKLEKADLRNVKEIQQYAFMGSAIKELILPKEGIVNVGAFSHCLGLTELYIPPKLEIKDRAFDTCTNLEEVLIDEGRTEFPQDVFAGIDRISVIYIPKDIAALNMFLSKSQYNYTYSSGSYYYRNRSVSKAGFEINTLCIIGEEDQEFLAKLKEAIESVNGFQVNNIRFTG